MRSERLWIALPYAVIFAVTAWFYQLAGEIEFTRRGDYPGPDFWPRMALAVMMIICVVQFGRLLFFGRSEHDIYADIASQSRNGRHRPARNCNGPPAHVFANRDCATTIGELPSSADVLRRRQESKRFSQAGQETDARCLTADVRLYDHFASIRTPRHPVHLRF